MPSDQARSTTAPCRGDEATGLIPAVSQTEFGEVLLAMAKSSSRSTAAAVLAMSAALECALPAAAEPVAAIAAPAGVAPAVRARLIAPHVALTRFRATAIFHYAAPRLPFAFHPAPAAPIKALPLRAPAGPLRVVPALLPGLELAALPDPGASDRCASRRSGVILSALPATPFTPLACEPDLSASGPDLRPSLVPGHNKRALYGPTYAPPSSAEGP